MKDGIYTFRPIGTVAAEAGRRYDAPRQGVLNSGPTGIVRLEPGMNLEQAAADLAGFERIWLLYVFHLNEHWKPRVHVPRGAAGKVGVLATRAPYRPNPIGLSCVRLLDVRGLDLLITESDLLDGTPILDVKPYVPYADAFPDAATGWLETADGQRYEVEATPAARERLDFLTAAGAGDMDAVLRRHLEFSPLDGRNKRIRRGRGEGWELAWRTWRFDFDVTEQPRRVTVRGVRSGYEAGELADPADPYDDKGMHADFIRAFPQHTDTD